MNTEKKNQHYVPKFYLRNFSFLSNKKQIGVFNICNKIFTQTAKLKTQASKNFFYGCDGKIEDALSVVEGDLAKVINEIIETEFLPHKGTKEHKHLLEFVSLTDLRNPVKVEQMKNMFIGMKERLLELDPEVDVKKFVPDFEHEEIIKVLLSQSAGMIQNMIDLDYKLLVNKTNVPFVTSDFPVVKYNQFLEELKWPYSKSGYGTVGLQIVVPLNHKLLILFFDSNIYKAGDKKSFCLNVDEVKDVDSLNVLQFLNCFKTIYFDEKCQHAYVNKLYSRSKNYKRANESSTELSHLIQDGDDEQKILNGKNNLLIFGSSDCECNLNVSGVKIHSKGRAYKFESTVIQTRPHCKKLM